MYIKENELIIRNAELSDAKQLETWWRDGKIMAHAGFPNGLDITSEEIEKSLKTDSDETRRRHIIEYNHQAIGEMNYRNLGDDSCEIGIKICVENMKEKGLGTRILKLFINQLFHTYGYEKIVLDTNLNNKRAQHVYEKLGFRKVKVQYDAWKDQVGQLQSIVDYEMKKDEFNAR